MRKIKSTYTKKFKPYIIYNKKRLYLDSLNDIRSNLRKKLKWIDMVLCFIIFMMSLNIKNLRVQLIETAKKYFA